MWLHSLQVIFAAACFVRLSAAVFADEAWNVDYHYALLGEPKEETTFFHQPNPSSKASLIYSLSEQGVLGAINPRDGSVVWRQPLLRDDTAQNASFLRAGEDRDVVVSGLGRQVAAWNAADGRLEWDLIVDGDLADVEILALDEGTPTTGAKDVIALSGGEHAAVRRIDGATGAVKWRHPLDGPDVPYQVSASATELYAIALHKTMLGYYKLKVISLDPVTGRKTDEHMLSSESELTTTDTIVSVGANSASPIIAWTDSAASVLKLNVLGTSGVSSFNIDKHGEGAVRRVRMHAPRHSNALAHFLVHYESDTAHWAEVFHIDVRNGKVEKAYSLPKAAGRGAFSTSVIDANVYFTRVTQTEVVTVASASHGILSRWSLQGARVADNSNSTPEPIHAVSEVSFKDNAVSAVRTALYTSTGDWILLRNGSPAWTRPEILATTIAATFAAPAEAEALVKQLQAEAHSNPVQAYSHRLQRHIADLKLLPAILSSLPQRIIDAFFGNSAEGGIGHDGFGFHQIIACATKSGRVVAFDAASPTKILWNRQVADLQPGQSWQPSLYSPRGGVIVVRSRADIGVEYSATDGELLASTLPVAEREVPSSKAMQYTIRSGGLEATLGERSAWHFVPANGETVISLVPRPINDPVASIGKVLGDRRVLYKYLDPNLALLVTGRNASRTASFYVLNTVSGAVIHSSMHTGVDLDAPISSMMSENWFAYSFTAEASDDSPKGHQLVVGELFESLVPNDRGLLSAKANYSSLESGAEPFSLVHTYQIPERISKMAVTRTRQGITSRQLLAVLPDSNALVGIPYGVLDPRRPVHRDPTKDEQMEGLVKYTPVLDFDPKWYLNHQREVVGIKDVETSPALIESTSLVFAYGLDIFGTRLSPSFSFDILGKDFNKFQMLATVAALAVATFVVAPLVMRKQVDQRWKLL
ncbi:hypothetical protein BAUCODRAFT_75439 [Baudoinia panamericana UAMH 10762]|uniref:ER membrane protein complex subunit 1 n=1 Tax=Baudoinia panamericana (strain UAMH 10762) TaxID=717646 RepID=M2MQG6_BAUPA|nr:uncharacterized protein BAUCODRAFT_75439 [Baudoinia panamericana UAMH 10762]EMC93733.1 hypothetical protein BAUCODRAFT_75439 [Baudoinia panamericana UAMH 10762]